MSDMLYNGPCEAGCESFHGGEKRHHPDCGHYPESLTKLNANRIEELEQAVRYEADLAQMALDSRKELEAKLAKAVEALDESVYLLAPDEKDMMRQAGVYRIVTTLAELKGETDD